MHRTRVELFSAHEEEAAGHRVIEPLRADEARKALEANLGAALGSPQTPDRPQRAAQRTLTAAGADATRNVQAPGTCAIFASHDMAELVDAAAKLEVADPEAEAAADEDAKKKKKKSKKKKKGGGGGEDAAMGDEAPAAAADAAGEAEAAEEDGADGEAGGDGAKSASQKKREKQKAAAARKKAAAEAEAATGSAVKAAARASVGADAAWATEIRGIGRWRCFPDCEPEGTPQTWPPTVPVVAQFPSGNVPLGEVHEYRDDNRCARARAAAAVRCGCRCTLPEARVLSAQVPHDVRRDA